MQRLPNEQYRNTLAGLDQLLNLINYHINVVQPARRTISDRELIQAASRLPYQLHIPMYLLKRRRQQASTTPRGVAE